MRDPFFSAFSHLMAAVADLSCRPGEGPYYYVNDGNGPSLVTVLPAAIRGIYSAIYKQCGGHARWGAEWQAQDHLMTVARQAAIVHKDKELLSAVEEVEKAWKVSDGGLL